MTDVAAAQKQWFGHPRGLATLFFTEMWERFSYYGMRALLFLFMTAAVTAKNPGLGLDDRTAGAVYGLYTAGVYALNLVGGWIADRLMGQRAAVFLGGVLIAAGNFTLAVRGMTPFYAGLALIVAGTSLLKPNVSTIVGDLYPEGGSRRDAGFSIFYMGINVGAMIGHRHGQMRPGQELRKVQNLDAFEDLLTHTFPFTTKTGRPRRKSFTRGLPVFVVDRES